SVRVALSLSAVVLLPIGKSTIASPLCLKLGKIRKAFGNILILLLAGCNLLFIAPDPFPVRSDLQLVGRDVLLVDLDVLLVNPDRLLCWEQASRRSRSEEHTSELQS